MNDRILGIISIRDEGPISLKLDWYGCDLMNLFCVVGDCIWINENEICFCYFIILIWFCNAIIGVINWIVKNAIKNLKTYKYSFEIELKYFDVFNIWQRIMKAYKYRMQYNNDSKCLCLFLVGNKVLGIWQYYLNNISIIRLLTLNQFNNV